MSPRSLDLGTTLPINVRGTSLSSHKDFKNRSPRALFAKRWESHYTKEYRVRILASILAKCELKKQLARWYFLYLHFLASRNLGLLSMVLNLDINLLSSFLKCCSLKVNVFVFIHRKTLPMAEVYIGYNLNAQTHTINSPAWSGLSQSYAF